MLWLSFVVSLAAVWLLDRIGNDKRLKAPGGKIPTTGGFGIILPLFLHCQVVGLSNVIIFCIWITFALGLLDDLWNPRFPLLKLIPEFAIATIMVATGHQLHWLSLDLPDKLLSAVWIVGIMNAVNFCDNMDGLAAGLAIIAGSFFYKITGDPLALIMCGALGGFLLFNYGRASIYMGDSGSLTIGFILAVLPMIHSNGIDANSTLLILSVPICDMVRLSITRPLLDKKPPWKGGLDHVSHNLARRFGQGRAVIFLYGLSALLGFAGVLANG